jgi:hypothetical protein
VDARKLVPVQSEINRAWAVISSNAKPTFFQDCLLSFSYKRPLKKSNIFVFETKFIIGTKRSLSDLKISGPKAIGLFSIQIFLEITKNFCFVFRNL